MVGQQVSVLLFIQHDTTLLILPVVQKVCEEDHYSEQKNVMFVFTRDQWQ